MHLLRINHLPRPPFFPPCTPDVVYDKKQLVKDFEQGK